MPHTLIQLSKFVFILIRSACAIQALYGLCQWCVYDRVEVGMGNPPSKGSDIESCGLSDHHGCQHRYSHLARPAQIKAYAFRGILFTTCNHLFFSGDVSLTLFSSLPSSLLTTLTLKMGSTYKYTWR